MSPKKSVPYLVDNDGLQVVSDDGIAAVFNKYFSSVFNAPQPTDLIVTDIVTRPKMENVLFYSNDIYCYLSHLNESSAPGPDKIDFDYFTKEIGFCAM